MEHVIKTKSGKRIVLEKLKCPVCGNTMLVDNSHPVMPVQEAWIKPMSPPFFGNIAGITTIYTSSLRCPNECCRLEMEHEVEEFLL